MRIVVVSAFRDMSRRVSPYMRRVAALARHVGGSHSVRCVAVWGDCRDDTERVLTREAARFGVDVGLINHETGKPNHGSCEHPERLAALTNVLMAGLTRIDERDDVALWVESDLLWEPHDVGSVIDMAWRRDSNFDIVAPFIYCGTGEQFYDIWGFRGLDGRRWSPMPPYHRDVARAKHPLIEVSTVGSCLAMNAHRVIGVEPVGADALVSWCAGARQAGLRIAAAREFRVEHPA